MIARATLLAGALALGGCTFPVEGAFLGRELPPAAERDRTILVIFNHGFSWTAAGTYRPALPPILEAARRRNPDLVIFAQLRNTVRLGPDDHAEYIRAAIGKFHRAHGIPPERIILAGQSCGGWGSLQAAAFWYPTIGGVVAFAPACHGRLPYADTVRQRRAADLAMLARRLIVPTVIFLYEGDSYYTLDDWEGFEARLPPGAPVRVERLRRDTVLAVCPRCEQDSHGAVWSHGFARAYLDSHLQPIIERVRARVRGTIAPGPRSLRLS